MIAYNKTWLRNLFVRQEVTKAYESRCITRIEAEGVNVNYPSPFYTPNVFIGFGLLLLTFVIMLFSFVLIGLLFTDLLNDWLTGFCLLFAAGLLISLEIMIRKKHHYNSGVDQALLLGAAIAFFCGIYYNIRPGNLSASILMLAISLPALVRYGNTLMAAIAYLSFLSILFNLLSGASPIFKILLPIIICLVSLITYLLIKKTNNATILIPYSKCMLVVEILSLLTMYLSVNYFVVREMSNQIFHLQLRVGQEIPYGYLFWFLTVTIPIIYLLAGLRNKDRMLIQVSILLLAAAVFTFKYYFNLMAIEIDLMIGGVFLITSIFFATRYLKVPRHGFTASPENHDTADELNAESLVIAETFKDEPHATGTAFGGGSFGGGGASSEF